MDSLDKIDMRSLFGMLNMDMNTLLNDDRKTEMLRILDEIESRCKGKFRSLDGK